MLGEWYLRPPKVHQRTKQDGRLDARGTLTVLDRDCRVCFLLAPHRIEFFVPIDIRQGELYRSSLGPGLTKTDCRRVHGGGIEGGGRQDGHWDCPALAQVDTVRETARLDVDSHVYDSLQFIRPDIARRSLRACHAPLVGRYEIAEEIRAVGGGVNGHTAGQQRVSGRIAGRARARRVREWPLC